jgi:hypothetical protein
MKKISLILAALFPVIASADVSLGVDLFSHLTRENAEARIAGQDTENKTTNFQFGLRPSLIIEPADHIEVVPNIGFSIGHWNHETILNDDVTNEEENTSIGIGAGCGLFFRLIDGDPFRLSLGPDLQVWLDNPDGENNDIFDFTVGIPVNMDLMLSQKLWARFSARMVALGYHNIEQGDNAHTSTVTFFDIKTILEPSVGFYFTF